MHGQPTSDLFSVGTGNACAVHNMPSDEYRNILLYMASWNVDLYPGRIAMAGVNRTKLQVNVSKYNIMYCFLFISYAVF